MESPAQSLKRLVNRKPVKSDALGDYWIHPIPIVDQMVLDGALREIFVKTHERIKDPKVQDQVMAQGLSIGTVQLALHKGEEDSSELVFPSFEEAYATLSSKPDVVFAIFELYAENFDLTKEEKKT